MKEWNKILKHTFEHICTALIDFTYEKGKHQLFYYNNLICENTLDYS